MHDILQEDILSINITRKSLNRSILLCLFAKPLQFLDSIINSVPITVVFCKNCESFSYIKNLLELVKAKASQL